MGPLASGDGGADARTAVAHHLRAEADRLADAVLARVEAAAPAGAAPDLATLRNLRLGARAAIDYFLTRLTASAERAPSGERGSRSDDAALFVAHGRAQHAAGRSLSELLDRKSVV